MLNKTLLLFSGGLDSTTLLAMLLKRGDHVTPLSFHYGQRHNEAEKYAMDKVSRYYGVKDNLLHMDIRIPDLSVLTKRGNMPHLTYDELQNEIGPSPTYVAFRNGIFLSYACAFALSTGIETVAIATHASDAHNWAYPDCTPEFTGAMGAAMFIGTYFKVRLIAPFMHMTKDEVVRSGLELRVPYQLTWSCYEGGDVPCGVCPTCLERQEAFRKNGFAPL